MFKTDDGAGINLKEMSLNINGNVYDQRFLSQIYNYYQQMIKTEFLMANYEFSSEKEAWFVAGEIQHDMDKYGMTEQAAIDNGLYNYIEKYRQKFNIEKVKSMRFDILFNRPFTDEYDISAGDFELKLEDGSTKKFGFTTYKYDVDSKNPNLVHVILYDTANNYKDIGMDVGYELYTNNLKNALFSEFHINCGDGIDLDIKPEKISELMLTYSDAITEKVPPEVLESANASLSYTKDGVYIKVSEASKALDELIAAGDWHIDEKELKLLALSNPYDFEYHDGIGRVSFGNYIYVLNVNLKNEDELVIEIGRCYPLLDMGETDEKAFFATTLNWNELESKYKSDIPEYFDIYIPITEKNANNIDLLKKEIVSELINKGLVTSLYTEEYQKLKDTGIGFPQQFYRRLDNLEKLYELRHHCPKAIIGKRKSPEEVDVFLNYYKKVYKLIVDEKAISLAEKTNESDIGELAREEYNRLFIKEMINDGNAPMDISASYIAGVAGIILPENYSYVHEKIEKIMREPEIKKLIKKAQSQDMGR